MTKRKNKYHGGFSEQVATIGLSAQEILLSTATRGSQYYEKKELE